VCLNFRPLSKVVRAFFSESVIAKDASELVPSVVQKVVRTAEESGPKQSPSRTSANA
jgi:hypothetical protein